MLLRDAARRIGVSRQAAHAMARDNRLVVSQPGRPGKDTGTRVTRESVERMRAARLEALRQQIERAAGDE